MRSAEDHGGRGQDEQADLAEAHLAARKQDQYNVVAAESQVKNYKRQLKELLQITGDETFDIAVPRLPTRWLAEIPALNGVYT